MAAALPHRLAVLVDIRNSAGQILLLRRIKSPNKGLCSPIGGKVDVERGESPAQCARRETMEEAGLDLPIERFHLGGLIAERGYEGQGHWLLFYYRVLGAVELEPFEMREGFIDWFDPAQIETLPLPETDRKIIWPMIRKHEGATPNDPPGFFSLFIDCQGNELRWHVEQETPAPSRSEP